MKDIYPVVVILLIFHSQVQGTNDSSVVSKVSAAAQGYFQDDLLQHFVCKVSRRAPLINRGYYVRWQAVDHCVKGFLRVTENCAGRQILSLGAGFDSLYFRLHAEGALERVVVFEVDFPDVTRRKAALIKGNDRLKDALPDWNHLEPTGPVCVSSAQYKLLGVDVRNEREVEEGLRVAGLQWDRPTLVLSEVVLTYMETKWSDAVIGWAARSLSQALFVMYEQIRPDDPFGRVMQNHFLKLNSKIHALCQYPDTSAQTKRFLQQGWEKCTCLDMNQFYFSLLSQDEQERVENMEPFDEFEEWHQKCSHYFILSASKGSLTSSALLEPPKESPVPWMVPKLEDFSIEALPLAGAPCVEAVGMASSVLEPGLLLLSGGFGRGGRDTAAMVLIREQTEWTRATVELEGDKGVRLYHTLTSVPGWGAVVTGGRTSPLNPIDSVLKVTHHLSDQPDSRTVLLSVEKMVCTGQAPKPRWRHTATLLNHKGKNYLFVFGGRTEKEPVLGDAHFLCLEDQHWTDARVHLFASSYPVTCSRRLYTFSDILYVLVQYSHSAHVIGENLVVVGGVWLQADGVPGVAVINLTTGSNIEVTIDTSSVPWPLMLHSFCSELLDSDRTEVVLIGGGGNCFSFGTHLNIHPVTLDLRPVLGH
uniref:tRNA wybutosine-synthesizing protein 4 n=1 Tax=Astyanax mexicanus TaxID=7994 RepID=A0A8B9L0D3_ASTMX